MEIVSVEAGEVVVRFLVEDVAILVEACDAALAYGKEFVELGRDADPVAHKGNYLRALRAALTALGVGTIARACVVGDQLSFCLEELDKLGFGGRCK